MTVEQVARTCHEVNRAFCESIGDFSQPEWALAPTWQQRSAQNGVRFHVERLRDGLPASPEASHENWLREKQAEGWVYGPAKDPLAKTHPCCVPYEQLPPEQRAKDALFVAVVHGLAHLIDEV